jgi:hypothetical protein
VTRTTKARWPLDSRDAPAITPDGLPGHEPWRGAAIRTYESGMMDEMAADAIDRALRRRD